METKHIVAVLIVLCLTIGGVAGGMVFAGSKANERENQLGRQCIEVGGSWVRHTSGPQCIK